MEDRAYDAVPRPREDVVFRRLAGDFAILDPARQVVHVLNPSAAAVWMLCDGTRNAEEVAGDVAAAFGVPDGRDVVADVHAAIGDFRERGLLR